MFINTVIAQPPPPSAPVPPVVPIDGLLDVFIIATVFFGIYMIYKNKKIKPL
jgi:hypothetical protein